MAAGLGFKDFTTGEVLTAADVDGYLMQGIWVFASAAARDAAVTSPQEGNACYLKDTNQVLTYNGSTWVAVGGGSPLTTKGDLYGFSTVDARIPIGANNTVLTADSAQTLGLKWAAPAGAGLVLIQAPTTFSAVTSQSFNDVFTSTYSNYRVLIHLTSTASNAGFRLRLRASGSDNSSSNYNNRNISMTGNTTVSGTYESNEAQCSLSYGETTGNITAVDIIGPQTSNATLVLPCSLTSSGVQFGGTFHNVASAFDGFTIFSSNTTNVAGTVSIYGYAK